MKRSEIPSSYKQLNVSDVYWDKTRNILILMREGGPDALDIVALGAASAWNDAGVNLETIVRFAQLWKRLAEK